MSVKYICDVCEKEAEKEDDFEHIVIRRNSKDMGPYTLEFDMCKSCSEKVLKPVKQYRSSLIITATQA